MRKRSRAYKLLPWSTDGLTDTHQRRRWQVTFITAGSVTMPGWRQRSRHVPDQSRNLEFPFGTSRTARIAHATSGAHAHEHAAFSVTAVLLGKRLVIVVRIILVDGSFDLRLEEIYVTISPGKLRKVSEITSLTRAMICLMHSPQSLGLPKIWTMRSVLRGQQTE